MNQHVIGLAGHDGTWLDADSSEWTENLFAATKHEGNAATMIVYHLRQKDIRAYTEPLITAAGRFKERNT